MPAELTWRLEIETKDIAGGVIDALRAMASMDSMIEKVSGTMPRKKYLSLRKQVDIGGRSLLRVVSVMICEVKGDEPNQDK